jgi:soluble lytic murein transglycosylase-like protein
VKYSDRSSMNLLWFAFILLVVAVTNAVAKADTLESQITKSARHAGVDPTLALAIAEVESGMNPDAVGALGEIGLFQLRPEYHAVKKGDVRHNIDAATKYLAYLKRKCGGYGDAFFVCYNYGTARPLKHPRLFPYYLKVKMVQARRRHGFAVARVEN